MSAPKERRIDRMQVRQVMTRKPAVVGPEAKLADAVTLMVDHRVRHVPVVNSARKVVEMLTDRDVRQVVGDSRTAFMHRDTAKRLRRTPVTAVMAKPAFTIEGDASIVEAAEQLIEQRIVALPVVDAQDGIVGMISYVDVIQALLPAHRVASDRAQDQVRRGRSNAR
jgi:acetoin utilization protein AcuB